MAQEVLQLDRDGRVLTVRLDSPPRGFMTDTMVKEFDALTRSLADDPTVGAVVITGAAEGVFLTHYDLGEIRSRSEAVVGTFSPAQAGVALRAVAGVLHIPCAERVIERTPAAGIPSLLRLHGVFRRMSRLDKVFVAAVNGVALGAGCELALACDVRIMAEGDHRIGLPEITIGMIPGGGGSQRLARILGPGRALEMMLEGRLLTAGEARDAGIVHRAVAAGALPDAAGSTAERLARRSPEAVAALKRVIYEGGPSSLERGLHIERAGFLSTSSTAAARRAVAAYDDQVHQLDAGAPWAIDSLYEPWREGTAVDMLP